MVATDIKPRYEVHKLEGDVEVTVFVKNDDGKLVKEQRTQPAGYMVYFPNGASIRVRTEEELKRLGFDIDAPLVDMVSGEVVPVKTQHGQLKSRSQQISGSRSRSQI
jgi:hypothetical protein